MGVSNGRRIRLLMPPFPADLKKSRAVLQRAVCHVGASLHHARNPRINN